MDCLIRQEEPRDYEEIGEVLQNAFFREGKDAEFNEWNLVEDIRASQFYIPELSLVAEVKGSSGAYYVFTHDN